MDEAIQKGCNLIVSHHPLIFRKLARLTGEDYVQQAVIKALANSIVIMSMHTNMDNARGGVNFKIAEKMGAAQCALHVDKDGRRIGVWFGSDRRV